MGKISFVQLEVSKAFVTLQIWGYEGWFFGVVFELRLQENNRHLIRSWINICDVFDVSDYFLARKSRTNLF